MSLTKTVSANTGITDPKADARARQLSGLKPWKKGQSGNPKGRPKKVREVEDKALDAAPIAIAEAVKLLTDEDARIRLAAIQLVLDRGMGKPNQSVKVDAKLDHTGSESISATTEWLEEIVRARSNSEAKKSLPN